MHLITVCELVLLLVIANATPLLSGALPGRWLGTPLDGNLRLADGRPLLGPAKTIRGFASSILATGIAGPLFGLTLLQGGAFGLLAMLGDLLSSFIKRRLGIASSQSAPLLDQLPESLLPLLVMQPVLGMNNSEMLVAVLVFGIIDWLYSWWRDKGDAA
jgi:CDP-2,3-bis-(O-geranylgeranyl)-sn-glycerol synthase